MSAVALKLRSDLVFSRQGGPEAGGVVVKNPASGRFFRLGELEGFIAQQLDGTTSLEDLQRRVQEKFGSDISTTALERFVGWLRERGLIAEEQATAGASSLAGRRVAGNLFYLRFKAFDPDRLLSWLASGLGFLFTPAFVATSAAFILVAVCITIGNWTEIQHEFFSLFRIESLLLAWLVLVGVIALHELAHGLTCKHFGGQVHELGFLLLYFQPAFYCNVSDAWLFPEKSKRLWVTFAGAYFEMFLWALATVIWRLTDFDATLNHLALVVVATSAVKSFFNLNPLIKLDGYYLLSDWLAIPNLRRKAFQYLMNRVKSWFGKPDEWLLQATPRERRIYLVYGLLAGGYTFWLLQWVLGSLGRYLVARYEGWGFVLFSALLMGIFRRPLGRLFASARADSTTADGKHHFCFPKKWAKALLILGVVGLGLHFWPMRLKVSGDFTIQPMRNADVRAEVEGFIVDIPHDEGDRVQKGEVIARLNDRDLRARLAELAAEIEADSAKLKMLKAGPRPEEIEQARTAVAKANEQLKYAKRVFDIDSVLAKQWLIAKRDYELSEENVAVREKELQAANDNLNLLLAGTRPEQIAAMAAEVNQLKAQQNYLQEQLKLLTVTSPVTGIIATHRIKEELGQHVKKGDLIAAVDELNTVVAEIVVSEKDIADVNVGQKVVLKARAMPQTSFEGTVTSIAPVASAPKENENPRNPRTILVMTQLENPALQLQPQMSGRAKIYCAEDNALHLLLRRFIRYFRVEFWSWW